MTILSLTEAAAQYPGKFFVTFGYEDNGSQDVGVYNSQEDALEDEDNGENTRMIARIKVEEGMIENV